MDRLTACDKTAINGHYSVRKGCANEARTRSRGVTSHTSIFSRRHSHYFGNSARLYATSSTHNPAVYREALRHAHGTANLERWRPVDELNESDTVNMDSSVAIHAGFPNPATERTSQPLSLDKLLIRHPSSTYFFRIRGHHWHDHGVFDGDIAVIDRAITPHKHDLVVWWQESGEFMLSLFTRSTQQNIWGTVAAIIHPRGT